MFDKLSSNKYYYYGEVYLAGSIKTEKRKDEQGNLREVIIFPLKLVNQNTKFIFKGEDRKEVEKEINDKIESISKERLHEIAKSKKPQRIKKITTSERVERDPIVAKDTKNRANGKCDLCGNDAPFVTENGPFLESHHVITIAEGGPDVIYNTVALCPNCHRRIHNLKDPKDYERLVKVLYNYLLSDEDKENLKNWEKLFN